MSPEELIIKQEKISRQGDEGSSIFISLEDDLMRIFDPSP